MEDTLEVWQRGPITGITPLLQPIAHALKQAAEEVQAIMENFPERLLWEKPASVASPAFHLQHVAGVIDRLFTYARQQSLTPAQLHALTIEGDCRATTATMAELVAAVCRQIDLAVEELSRVDPEELTRDRVVGRKRLGTTLIGIYVHTAEHTMRHIGQLSVTVRVLKNL